MRGRWCVLALALAGCGDGTTPAGDGAVGGDGAGGGDGPSNADAAPGLDVPVPGDVVTTMDVPARTDVPAPRDVVTAMDSSVGACTPACTANAHCIAGSCQCDPWFVAMSGRCVAPTIPNPTTHTDTDVCAMWTEGHRTTASAAFTPGTGGMCDPGTMSRDALNDTLRRLGMFRWLVGLGPVTDNDTANANDQQCALMEQLHGFPGPSNPDPHHPATSWACYTAAGATAAGQSNISWGTSSAADAVDNYIRDNGNETTLGHRRWLLHPPLGPIGIGFNGSTNCMGVLTMSGGGTAPGPYWTYPPAGPSPVSIFSGYWSFHTTLGISGATVRVVRMADGMNMAIRMLTLGSGYGDPTLAWTPMGWTPRAGDAFQVTVSGLTGAMTSVTYTARAIACP